MRFVLIILAALTLVGCDYLPIGDPHAGLLMSRFQSGATRKETLAGLPSNPTVIEDSSEPPSDKRPPYAMYTVAFEGFPHCGQTGELRLSFFNDRLFEVWFFPSDPAKCIVSFDTSQVSVRDDVELSGIDVLFRVTEDWSGRRYACWSNRKTASELRSWIMSYA